MTICPGVAIAPRIIDGARAVVSINLDKKNGFVEVCL